MLVFGLNILVDLLYSNVVIFIFSGCVCLVIWVVIEDGNV